jgi:penicillin-binding protein 2
MLQPRLIHTGKDQTAPSLGLPQEHIDYVHQAMSDVVNGPGTAGRARLPIPDVKLAGKTGTAQVVSLSVSSGKSGPWKYRDHGHFICFAPFDRPKYACAVVIEHGGGSGAAYPVARDVMTFLFDPAKALETLHGFEAGWGGTPQQRMDRRYATYVAQYGDAAPKVSEAEQQEKVEEAVEAEPVSSQPIVEEAQAPRPEPVATEAPGGARRQGAEPATSLPPDADAPVDAPIVLPPPPPGGTR